MKRIKKLNNPPRFISYASVGGYEESLGPLGDKFDFLDKSDRFGQKTWELAEGEMGRCAMNIALSKANLSHEDIGLLIAGDLQNQCVASSVGLDSFGIPFLGVYGACSTCTESLLILASMMSEGYTSIGAAITTSHNSAAERQFRTPIEYGAQRTPSAQWTATAGGAFILSCDRNITEKSRVGNVEISEVMAGRIIDGATTDASNMGGAMSFAAIDTILAYFNESGSDVREFDYITVSLAVIYLTASELPQRRRISVSICSIDRGLSAMDLAAASNFSYSVLPSSIAKRFWAVSSFSFVSAIDLASCSSSCRSET